MEKLNNLPHKNLFYFGIIVVLIFLSLSYWQLTRYQEDKSIMESIESKDNVNKISVSELNDINNYFEEFTKIELKDNLEKDIRYQYTTHGIHKDDLNFIINKFPIKKFGSQGQQKTFLIALKLAQFDYLAKLSEIPILLLDDIFDKLDDIRVKKIIDLVNEENFNQIFISDTNKQRSETIIKQVNKSYKIFEI